MKKLALILVLLVLALVPVVASAQTDAPDPSPTLPVPDPQPQPSGTQLSDVLIWLASGGGAGIAAYWLINKLRRDSWSSEKTRYVALALTVIVAGGAFALAVLLGYVPAPGGPQNWAEELFSVCLVAVLMSQGLHGRLQLREAR